MLTPVMFSSHFVHVLGRWRISKVHDSKEEGVQQGRSGESRRHVLLATYHAAISLCGGCGAMTTGCFWCHTCLVYTNAQKLSSGGWFAAVTSNGHQRSSLVAITCFALRAGTKAGLYLTIDTRSWMHECMVVVRSK